MGEGRGALGPVLGVKPSRSHEPSIISPDPNHDLLTGL